jgi:class 3 adenylate cyclase
VVRRREPGEFSGETVQLLETFASQSALAIQNAQVFRDVEERSRQVEMELRRFLPSQVVDVIVTSGDESILESHRREITVVFCDLRGFTAFAESVEPEILMDVLHKYHEALGKLIFEFEGTLERFTGDGLMVFFNDPVECDDPALRAVRMAVEMQERVGELALEWKKKGHDLQLGVGIAQGFATAGRIGFEGRSDYAAIGTVTNLSARLCDKAGGGEILVGRRVFATTEEAIEAEPVEPLSLKGFPTPVDAFKVTGLKDVYAGAGRE